ncbi:FAD-binding domain-containing protein [Hypoxylon sp. FL1150]|nr:FAD-binding domain-containing protein [Hypoxylon sp. FL1150]
MIPTAAMMTTGRLVGLTSFLALVIALGVRYSNYGSTNHCRSIPGDLSWPTKADWNQLNATVGGRLIATSPIAASCHYSSSLGGSATSSSTFDQKACDALRNEWFFPSTHLNSSSSPMAYQFTNNSCNPFLDPDTPCNLDGLATFTVNATNAADFQAAVRFVKRHNIRLVIRNTGHDYLGKSTGAHALALWTHHLKAMELIPEYQDQVSAYQGPAIKLGAGVEALEAYEFAHSHGLIVVGGNCPNVGLAGGYTQGGGISILSSKYGLAADQVLAWEVVTAAGDYVTASATENSDLFWALRGGGGGTYGVVVSMTVKAFPDTHFSTAYITVLNDGDNTDAIYSAMGTFFQSLPALVDAGAWVVWVAAPFGFMVIPAMVADLRAAELDAHFQATRDKMDELGLQYQYSSAEHPDFISSYNSVPTSWNVSSHNLGGRLIPRELVGDQESTESLVAAVRNIASQALMSGVAFNVSRAVSSPGDVAAHPYFRKTLMSGVVGTPLNYTDWDATRTAQNLITDVLLPELQAITPDGAVYLNEADYQDPNFKVNFYGDHYERLLAIKKKYDPEDIFYVKTGVGSDRWIERSDGRLCTI